MFKKITVAFLVLVALLLLVFLVATGGEAQPQSTTFAASSAATANSVANASAAAAIARYEARAAAAPAFIEIELQEADAMRQLNVLKQERLATIQVERYELFADITFVAAVGVIGLILVPVAAIISATLFSGYQTANYRLVAHAVRPAQIAERKQSLELLQWNHDYGRISDELKALPHHPATQLGSGSTTGGTTSGTSRNQLNSVTLRAGGGEGESPVAGVSHADYRVIVAHLDAHRSHNYIAAQLGGNRAMTMSKIRHVAEYRG